MAGALIRTSAGVPKFGYDPADRPAVLTRLLTPAEISAGDFDWPGAGADVAATFGALTREGEGGVAVTGSSIASGDPSGHWAITSGRIAPSAAGVGNLAGTYNLTLDNDETVAITIAANRFDVRTDAEVAAVIALGSASRSGRTIHLRPGTYAQINLAGLANTDWCTIQSESKNATYTWGYGATETIVGRSGQAQVAGVNFGSLGAAYWRLRNLDLFRAAEATAVSSGSLQIVSLLGASNIDIGFCEIHSSQLTYTQSPGNEWVRQYRGIGWNTSSANPNSNITVSDNFIHSCGQGLTITCKDAVTITRNVFRDIGRAFCEIFDRFPGTIAQREVTNLLIRDNVMIGNTGSFVDAGIHSSAIPFQAEYKDGIEITANIILPVYEWSFTGPPDVDGMNGDTYARNIVMRGNTIVALQQDFRIVAPGGTCRVIGNTLFLRLRLTEAANSSAAGEDSSGPEIEFGGTADGTGHVVAHNLQMGTTSGLRWGGGVIGTAAASATTNINNLGLGSGNRIATSAGVITDWGDTDNGITINGGSRNVRLDVLFTGADNAAGDFVEIADPAVLTVRSDIAEHLSGTTGGAAADYWVGALGSGYVTFSAGHLTNPQTSTIDETMEPA